MKSSDHIKTLAKASILSCMAACIVLFAGCSSPSKSSTPDVYLGGQYYGDAVHPAELNDRQASSANAH